MPGGSDSVAHSDIVGVDVEVVRRCGAACQDELSHGQLAGNVHVIALQNSEVLMVCHHATVLKIIDSRKFVCARARPQQHAGSALQDSLQAMNRLSL